MQEETQVLRYCGHAVLQSKKSAAVLQSCGAAVKREKVKAGGYQVGG
jgi:hypothetical protein